MLTTVVSKVNGVVYGLFERIGIMPAHTINAPGNLKAFLMLIRRCEGTSGKDGYRMHFGGSLFTSFADHPRKVIKKSGYSSSAAGAYQFLTSTWDAVAKSEKLKNFTPESQDQGAIRLIKNRGAFDDVNAGRLEDAIKKCAKEWASLPTSPYGQPTRTMSDCKQFFKDYGGAIV